MKWSFLLGVAPFILGLGILVSFACTSGENTNATPGPARLLAETPTSTPTPQPTPQPTPTPAPISLPPQVTLDLDPSLTEQENEYFKRRLGDILQIAEADLGITIPAFKVVAYRDQDQMIAKKAAWDGVSPDALGGNRFWCDFCGETDYGAVFIRIGEGWFNESGFPRVHIGVAVLAHELHHELQAQAVGKSWSTHLWAPNWFTEGAAQWWGYKTVSAILNRPISDEFLKQELNSVRINPVSLREMEGPRFYTTERAYNYGLVAIDFLMKRGHESTQLIRLWETMNRNGSRQTAFQTTFGLSANEFYAQFEEYRVPQKPHTLSGTLTSSSGVLPDSPIYVCPAGDLNNCRQIAVEGTSFKITLPAGVYVVTMRNGTGAHSYLGPSGFSSRLSFSEAVKIDLQSGDVTGFEITFN